MEPVAVSSFTPDTAKVVNLYCMVSFRIIIIQDNNFLGVRTGSKFTNIFYIGNINGSWKNIKGIAGSFVRARTIINRYRREIQIWSNTINKKCVVEEVINFPIIESSRLNFPVLYFL